MASPLEVLHVELIQHILTFLEFSDVASLRLTSQTMEDIVSGGSFAARFIDKDVLLTTSKLRDMVRMMGEGRFGCLMRSCTVIGVVRGHPMVVIEVGDESTDINELVQDEKTAADENKGEDEGDEQLLLLAEAFRTLKQRSPNRGLTSLCLRVTARIEGEDGELIEPDRCRSYVPVWDAALRTFNVTMAALNKSQLPVYEHLDIYGSLRGCSLSCHAFLSFAQESVSMSVFKTLKRLTMSLSASYDTGATHPSHALHSEREIAAQLMSVNLVFHAIRQVSHSIPELESLELHWYQMINVVDTLPDPSTTLNTSSAFKCLQHCSLQGIYTSETELLQFLEAVRPTSLTLKDIRLYKGKYDPIFTYMTNPESPIKSYYIDDILQVHNLIHFHTPGTSKFRYLRRVMGPSTLTREGSLAKEAISYEIAPSRAVGSPERMRWWKGKQEEFGPPESFGWDFIKLNRPKIVTAADEDDED